MEWGTFITVISAVYIAWFGFNFLFDLFIGGKPKIQSQDGIQYNISDLMGEDEQAQVVNAQDYEEKPVAVHHAKDTTPPVSSGILKPAAKAAGSPVAESSDQHASTPAAELKPPMAAEYDDWDSPVNEAQEAKIDIPVQGQAMPITSFIEALKEKARLESATISF